MRWDIEAITRCSFKDSQHVHATPHFVSEGRCALNDNDRTHNPFPFQFGDCNNPYYSGSVLRRGNENSLGNETARRAWGANPTRTCNARLIMYLWHIGYPDEVVICLVMSVHSWDSSKLRSGFTFLANPDIPSVDEHFLARHPLDQKAYKIMRYTPKYVESIRKIVSPLYVHTHHNGFCWCASSSIRFRMASTAMVRWEYTQNPGRAMREVTVHCTCFLWGQERLGVRS